MLTCRVLTVSVNLKNLLQAKSSVWLVLLKLWFFPVRDSHFNRLCGVLFSTTTSFRAGITLRCNDVRCRSTLLYVGATHILSLCASIYDNIFLQRTSLQRSCSPDLTKKMNVPVVSRARVLLGTGEGWLKANMGRTREKFLCNVQNGNETMLWSIMMRNPEKSTVSHVLELYVKNYRERYFSKKFQISPIRVGCK